MKCDILVGSDNLLSLKLRSEDLRKFKFSLLNDQIKVIKITIKKTYTLCIGISLCIFSHYSLYLLVP